MRILVVNNNTGLMPQIRMMLTGHNVTEKMHWEVKKNMADDFDLVVLSGGRGRAVVRNRNHFKKERQLIRGSKTPIIGICLGAQMIADVYNAKLKRMEVRRRGYVTVSLGDKNNFDKLHFSSFKAYQMHIWKIINLQSDLTELASSKDGVEIFKHNYKPFYGLQFHPEAGIVHKRGAKIFWRIANSLVQKPTLKNIQDPVTAKSKFADRLSNLVKISKDSSR